MTAYFSCDNDIDERDESTNSPIFSKPVIGPKGITITVWLRHGEKQYANNRGPPDKPAFDPPLADVESNDRRAFSKLVDTIVLTSKKAAFRLGELTNSPPHVVSSISTVVTSPYMRTRETARRLIEAARMCGDTGASADPIVFIDTEIAEFLGHHRAPLDTKKVFYPDTLKICGDLLPPFLETSENLRIRCMDHALKYIMREPDSAHVKHREADLSIVVSHGIVIANVISFINKLFKNKGGIIQETLSVDQSPNLPEKEEENSPKPSKIRNLASNVQKLFNASSSHRVSTTGSIDSSVGSGASSIRTPNSFNQNQWNYLGPLCGTIVAVSWVGETQKAVVYANF
jgi:broad specificity phosphatase PhoE